MRLITNCENIIDSRDIIERLEELESEIQDALDELNEGQENQIDFNDFINSDEYDTPDQDTIDEYKALKALDEQGRGYAPDWTYGEALINEKYFTEYAEELADDIGAIDKKAGWPLTHIDWNAAAEDLKQDYTEIDFDGTTFLVRS